jgi:hypothetical protein
MYLRILNEKGAGTELILAAVEIHGREILCPNLYDLACLE